MPAELIAQCRQHLRSERLLLTRDKALHERERDHRRGHIGIDRRLYSPAALARVLNVALNFSQIRGLTESVLGQLQQPRANDAALIPDMRNLAHVQIETFRLAHDLETLGISLHHAILDAVMDHLHKMTSAD